MTTNNIILYRHFNIKAVRDIKANEEILVNYVGTQREGICGYIYCNVCM